MPQIPKNEYDASYFDGRLQATRHNAGYSVYDKSCVFSQYDENNNFVEGSVYDFTSLDVLNRYAVGNKKVLDIGCAKGYLVEALVNRGVDAYGIDWSPYAISEGQSEMPSISSRLILVDDVLSTLPTYRNNEWQLIIMTDTICCFTDTEVQNILVPELNRTGRDLFFKILRTPNPSFYNAKTIEEWRDQFSWKQGTVFAYDKNNWVVK